MPNRHADCMLQAERNLEQAIDSQAAERHEWACFAAQQAAELGLKALHLHLRQDASGVAARLLQELPDTVVVPEGLLDKARVLDSYFVSARYPDVHAAGSPGENYGPRQSEEGIRYAREILEFVRAEMA